jgi:hypothetical protein
MSLREAMDRLFEDSFIGLSNWAPLSGIEGSLAVDVYETKDDIVVKASLPGVNPDDIDINVQGDLLTIRGEMKEEQQTEEENYHRRERRYGAYVPDTPGSQQRCHRQSGSDLRQRHPDAAPSEGRRGQAAHHPGKASQRKRSASRSKVRPGLRSRSRF